MPPAYVPDANERDHGKLETLSISLQAPPRSTECVVANGSSRSHWPYQCCANALEPLKIPPAGAECGTPRILVLAVTAAAAPA